MGSWLIEKFKDFDSKIAILYNDKKYTYRELYEKIREFLSFFQGKNIKKGEVVALLGNYSFENLALLLALKENKNIIVPITSTKEHEIQERLKEGNVDKVLKIENSLIKVQELDSNEKHLLIKKLQEKGKSGLILFSSGSTGKPKAMIHDFDNLVDSYEGRKEKNINTLIFLSFDHIGGIDTIFRQFSIGGTITIPYSRSPDAICKVIEKHQVNVLPASPTFLNLLLISGIYKEYDLSSLNIIAFGAEPMPEYLLKELKKTFPKVNFQQKYGTSETNAVKVINKNNNGLYIKIDDLNIEYKIVDDELWLRSKTQILGYLNAPMDSFTEDGWFRTGDLVEVKQDGYLKIIGRSKEIINVGGEKVLPQEVENVILELDEVVDVMVYGESNPITGQTVVADIVLKDGIDKKEAKKLIRKHCRSKLDNYKVPTKINFVEKISFGDRFKKIRRKS
ncbi:AMP-dependent synthetase and ligase [Deferribacter desulfuricans SSM1]|uniref:AMP-dependent synthetase and ligase n=1 Tax=Deferribacter desulfuricans (strain DSM 14783 / JCM 11476 / NBRC 101012 / SSM1) TaxID=639282 RepID=D3PB94_DEFDS|nr:fatty acid--CoA ligase family protein [Deferribacter desulfuricans]BAI79867.1 AMP-dependent synthetase and ligase [Deferribacter desulfuricans SSM1]